MLQRVGTIRERVSEKEGGRAREKEGRRDREAANLYISFLYSSGSTWLYCSMSWLVRTVQRSTSFLRAAFSASKEFLVDLSETLASFASTSSDSNSRHCSSQEDSYKAHCQQSVKGKKMLYCRMLKLSSQDAETLVHTMAPIKKISLTEKWPA